jgi:hypothetical protein
MPTIERQFSPRETDKSFTTCETVTVSLAMFRGSLSWRADVLRDGIARPWQRLANDTGNGLWPCEVALLLPRD